MILLLHEFLARAARELPDKVALVAGERRVRYAALAADVWSLARWLAGAGVLPGDRVVVLASSSPAAAASFWAVLVAGGVVVMVHPHTRHDRLAYILADSGAALLIADASLAETFLAALAADVQVRGARPCVREVLAIGQATEASARGVAFDEAIARGATDSRRLPTPSPSDLAALIYTSGSTGEPKAVMLTHGNMVAATVSISSYLDLRADDVLISVLPLSFDYGLYQMILSIGAGARLVLERSFDLPGQVLNRIVREQVTVLPGVPTLFAMLVRLAARGRWDLSRVRIVTSTAAVLGERQIGWLTETFPGAALFSVYGLTECKRCTYLPPADLSRKPDSVGIAIPGNEVWLVDADDRVLGPGVVGELVVRGPTVMAGYWQRPEETAHRLRPWRAPGAETDERVLYTGDLCRMDEEGYLYFVGRMDDVIKSRGEMVAPTVVEAVLRAVPFVRDAAVIGVPDDVLGEVVKAFVVPEPNGSLNAAALQAACRVRLEPHMIPREIVIVDALPRTAHGELERSALV